MVEHPATTPPRDSLSCSWVSSGRLPSRSHTTSTRNSHSSVRVPSVQPCARGAATNIMAEDDLRYKEYKAQVPPKWAEFDQRRVPCSKRGAFGGFLKNALSKRGIASAGGGAGGCASDPEGSTAGYEWDDDGGGGGGTTRRPGGKKRSWIEDMMAYCKEQDQKAVAKEKSQQLEVELRRRQERANTQREKILAAAAMPATSLSSAAAGPSQARSSGPSTLVCTALELETTAMINRYETRVEERFQRNEAVLIKHLDVAKEKRKRIKGALEERSQFLHDEIEQNERAAHKRLSSIQEAKMKRLQEEIRSSEIRSKALEERVRVAREALNQHRAEVREETDRHIAEALQAREAKRQAYESQLHQQIEQTNQRLADAKQEHHVAVMEDRVGKALARAEEERNRQRAAQLSSCERAAQQRARAIKDKEAHDSEVQQSWVERNAQRERQSQSKIERLADRSMELNVSVIKRVHSPPLALSPARLESAAATASGTLNTSDVAENVWMHMERHDAVLASKYEHALAVEQREYEHEQAYLTRHRAELAAMHAKGEERTRKLHATRMKAINAERERAERIEREVAAKQKKSEKILGDLRSEAQESRQEVNAEKARKAKAAIELTQVIQRQQLLDATNRKDAKMRAKAAEREAARKIQLEEQQAAQAARWEETTRHISEVQECREQALLNSLHDKDAMRVRAALQREETTLQMQRRLQEHAEAKAAALREEDAARAARAAKRADLLAHKDQVWAASHKQQLRQDREYRANQAAELDYRTAMAQQRLEAQQAERMNRTVDRIEYAYGRHTPTLPTYTYHPPPRPKSTT